MPITDFAKRAPRPLVAFHLFVHYIRYKERYIYIHVFTISSAINHFFFQRLGSPGDCRPNRSHPWFWWNQAIQKSNMRKKERENGQCKRELTCKTICTCKIKNALSEGREEGGDTALTLMRSDIIIRSVCLHHMPHIACDTLRATHHWHTLCWHTRTDSPYTSLPERYVHTLLWHAQYNTQDSEWWSHTHAMPPHYKTRCGEWQGALTLMPAGPRRCPLQYLWARYRRDQVPCGHTHRDWIHLFVSVYISRTSTMPSLLYSSRKWALANAIANACRQHTHIISMYLRDAILGSSTYYSTCPQRRCHARRYTCSRHAHTSNATLITAYIEEPEWQEGTQSNTSCNTLLWHLHCNTQESEWSRHTHTTPPHCSARLKSGSRHLLQCRQLNQGTHCNTRQRVEVQRKKDVNIISPQRYCHARKYTCLRHAHTRYASLITAHIEEPGGKGALSPILD